MIVGTLLATDDRFNWRTTEDASKYTRISEQRIRMCMDTGQSWRGWTFDEYDDPKPEERLTYTGLTRCPTCNVTIYCREGRGVCRECGDVMLTKRSFKK